MEFTSSINACHRFSSSVNFMWDLSNYLYQAVMFLEGSFVSLFFLCLQKKNSRSKDKDLFEFFS